MNIFKDYPVNAKAALDNLTQPLSNARHDLECAFKNMDVKLSYRDALIMNDKFYVMSQEITILNKKLAEGGFLEC